MANELDLKILNGDLDFGPDGEPVMVATVDCVAQDVGNCLRASGLALQLVADDLSPNGVLRQLSSLVEQDLRIQAGTAKAEVLGLGRVQVTATSVAGETITVTTS